MYRIDKTDYGLKVTARGVIKAGEIRQYLYELKEMSRKCKPSFSIYFDLRDICPFDAEGKAEAKKSNEFIRTHNVLRTVSVTSNPAAHVQLQQLTYESCLEDRKRYIDASSNPNWERDALAWILHGIDPDKKAPVESKATL